jgi:hypothetical protein
MAILQQSKNQVEVRIKREPEGRYFDELVKIGDAQVSEVRTCEHYIVGEPGVSCSIEVTFKAGYDFGKCERVKVCLFTHGRNEVVAQASFNKKKRTITCKDFKLRLYKTDLLIGGQRLEGASLAFKQLKIGGASLGIDRP